MNIEKVLKVSMILIVISFVISIVSIYKIKLDKPVFLKNYKEVEVVENDNIYSMGGGNIELKYISNRDDKRIVKSIVFKEATELNFQVGGQQSYNQGINLFNDNIIAEDYGRYSVHTIYLTLNSSNDKYNLSKDIILDKATIIFNDGLTIDVDLGKIILYKSDNSKNSLESIGFNGSSDGRDQSIFYIEDYIEVSKVHSPLFIDTKDLFNFNIDKLGYMDSINTIYNKYEYLYFTSQFNNVDDIERKLYSYDIRPVIYFKDKSGKEFKERVYNIQYNPSFNVKDIYKYLRIKGEI